MGWMEVNHKIEKKVNRVNRISMSGRFDLYSKIYLKSDFEF